jgi:hypothetical protein
MITAGTWQFRSEGEGHAIHVGGRHWAGILAGGVVIVISFAMDYVKIMAGGTPQNFNWAIFLAGLGLSCLSYGSAALAPSRRASKAAGARGY